MHAMSRRSSRLPWGGLVLYFALCALAQACEAPPPGAGASAPVLNLRLDNDTFGSGGQDSGYTNGFQISWMSANLDEAGRADDPRCPKALARAVRRYLAWVRPEGFDETNVVLGLGQAIYTPRRRSATWLQLDDRPYAAVLLLGVGYNARTGDHLRSSVLRVGMVGPSARGEEVQNGFHKLIGVKRRYGWQHQLRDEPVLQLVHERLRRHGQRPTRRGWHWDAITHWGGSVGNLATYANAGAEWRFGHELPDDFGSNPLRPAGENTAPVLRLPEGDWRVHVFASVDLRLVVRDLTLDGNSWKDSHSVDKYPVVADFGVGASLAVGEWKLALGHYNRTREFRGQRTAPVFGSVTISRRF